MDEERRSAGALAQQLRQLAADHGETAGAAAVQATAERGLAGELNGVQRQAIVAGSALAAMHAIEARNAKAKQDATKSAIGRIAGVLGGGFGSTVAEEGDRMHQARLQLALTQARTDAQRIAILQKELKGTTDVVERLQLQTQIEGLRNSTAKAHTSELGQQLKLNESIYDSQQKQYRAALDARLAAIDDRKQRILEADELRRAANTASNAKDPRIRALAALTLERIPLEQQRRQLDLAEKGATAGAPIVNGKLYQSLAGQGRAGQATAPPGMPGGPGVAPEAATAAGGITLINQLVVDGKVLADVMNPYIADQLFRAWQQSRAGGGGEATA